ncbi:MAG: DNA photolyase family protein [Ignavibacteria bacterium]|nr:DNA photolyase family protein [Ignavibacteria bacterium]
MLYAFWFRKDLRIIDNNALSVFIDLLENKFNPSCDRILFFYIKNNDKFNYYGKKRVKFLFECLVDLENSLKKYGFDLIILNGSADEVIKKIFNDFDSITLFANKQFEPYCIKRDNLIADLVRARGTFHLFNDAVISEPGSLLKDDGLPYTVYTPYKKKFLNLLNNHLYKEHNSDLARIKKFSNHQYEPGRRITIKDIARKLTQNESVFFKGGRKEALKLLNNFLSDKIFEYDRNRDFPSLNATSLISPHLHFGTISIRECFRLAFDKIKNKNSKGVEVWISELIWREFYYQIAFHFPYVIDGAFKKEYDNIQWENDNDKFVRWCNGLTGYPIVDAGMRQLLKEGWMHNRLRMITAMFLTKDLLIDWKWGEKFFAEHLIDLDFANNNGGWQWSASTGCDAQPYFRIFNPYLQSKKFDPEGLYIKKYLPELSNLNGDLIHKPELELLKPLNYPPPIVDHFKMKELAISKYKEVIKFKN